MRMLSKAPDDRYPSAIALEKALAACTVHLAGTPADQREQALGPSREMGQESRETVDATKYSPVQIQKWNPVHWGTGRLHRSHTQSVNVDPLALLSGQLGTDARLCFFGQLVGADGAREHEGLYFSLCVATK